MHALLEVRPILGTALDYTIRSCVGLRQHLSQLWIADLRQRRWKYCRQISSQVKHLAAGQMERHQVGGDHCPNQAVYLLHEAIENVVKPESATPKLCKAVAGADPETGQQDGQEFVF